MIDIEIFSCVYLYISIFEKHTHIPTHLIMTISVLHWEGFAVTGGGKKTLPISHSTVYVLFKFGREHA